ncbi:MAG TPA: flavin reductase family protein [candidate division Zixibacteria bacterium]
MAKKQLPPQALLIPLPVVMVSCQSKGGPNIITLAWAGVVCSEPPMVGISIRPSRYSFGIIRDSKEFVLNVVNEDLIRQADFCGSHSGRDVDKFKELNLTPIKGEKVKSPLIKESPINLECQVKDIIELGTHHLFLGEIVATHIDERYLDSNGNPDIAKIRPAVYCTKAHQYWGGLSKVLGTYGYTAKKR